MKLLICTQKVDMDDDVLGFFHGWIKKFSENFEKVNVLCLEKGKYDLPENVEIFSLGKEIKGSKINYIFRFYKYIWKKRKDYDCVFVHMNPEYVILGGLVWRIFGKKIAMWYAHKKGSFLRVIALFFCHRVFSVSKESFVNHKSKKFRAMGHGINTDFFKCGLPKEGGEKKKIITIGRLSPVKRCGVLLEAANIFLQEKEKANFEIEFIGSGSSEKDKSYIDEMKKQINNFGITEQVKFTGSVPNNKILPFLCEAEVFVSMQQIGGLGKSTLEAMSAGVLTVVCTPSLNNYLGRAKDYLFYDGSAVDLAEKLKKVFDLNENEKKEFSSLLRNIVVEYHNLDNLIKKIKQEFFILS